VKLLLDEMLNARIAEQLRRRGHDAEAIQGNAELEGKKDPEVLRAARELARVIVTDNVQDFTRLHQLFLASAEDHAGIILVSPSRFPRSKRTIGMWVKALDTFLRHHSETSLKNTITWLS
jgi:predicted nuclease of predicted toxin-antitoxin system